MEAGLPDQLADLGALGRAHRHQRGGNAECAGHHQGEVRQGGRGVILKLSQLAAHGHHLRPHGLKAPVEGERPAALLEQETDRGARREQ